jgi:hypothetical protein
MRCRAAVSLAVTLALLGMPATAGAIRPATEKEIAEFRSALTVVERADCGVALAAGANGGGSGCKTAPRPDYEPLISEARVSTIDESWATAYVDPLPKSEEAGTAIFRAEGGRWYAGKFGNGCTLGQELGMEHRTVTTLMPDLVTAMGCTPMLTTRVRCLDVLRTSLLALEEPAQCAVSPPAGTPLAGWMNIRELRWRHWGDEGSAWALGVLKGIPGRLLRGGRRQPGRAESGVASLSPAKPVDLQKVRLVASGRVSCETSYFYSRLRVVSAFGRFTLSLPTCPDVFFGPGP